jgi:hypothetical protein
MRPFDPDAQRWHFVPARPEAEIRFRRWTIVIIVLLAMLVTGLFLTIVIPRPAGSASFAAPEAGTSVVSSASGWVYPKSAA